MNKFEIFLLVLLTVLFLIDMVLRYDIAIRKSKLEREQLDHIRTLINIGRGDLTMYMIKNGLLDEKVLVGVEDKMVEAEQLLFNRF